MQNKKENLQNNITLFFYTDHYNKDRLITQLCRQFGIGVRKLKPSDVNTPLAALVSPGMKGSSFPKEAAWTKQKAPEGYLLPEIMIFSGFSQEFLFQFLSAYKDAGIEKISLKAMVTPYNFSWSLFSLIKELEREQTEMLLRIRGQKEGDK